jgi:CCR4-NOT transcriptional regulation complex NOT5 subunit
MSCLHLSTALDSMRERLRRVSPVSAASIALLFQAHDEDDDDEEGGHYHPLYDEDNFRGSRSESSDLTTMSSSSSSNTSRARRRDDESVDALGMSHPFASVDIAAIQRAMAQKHGLPLQSSNSGSASAPPTTSPSDNANFSLNSTVGSILLPVSEEFAEMESDQSSVPSSISATTSSLKDKSVIRLSAFQPQSSSPTRSGAPSSLLGPSQSSVVPARPSNSSAAPFFGRGQDDPNDPQTPLIVLDAVSTVQTFLFGIIP